MFQLVYSIWYIGLCSYNKTVEMWATPRAQNITTGKLNGKDDHTNNNIKIKYLHQQTYDYLFRSKP